MAPLNVAALAKSQCWWANMFIMFRHLPTSACCYFLFFPPIFSLYFLLGIFSLMILIPPLICSSEPASFLQKSRSSKPTVTDCWRWCSVSTYKPHSSTNTLWPAGAWWLRDFRIIITVLGETWQPHGLQAWLDTMNTKLLVTSWLCTRRSVFARHIQSWSHLII